MFSATSVCSEVVIVEQIEAAVGNEYLRDADSVGRLIVLDDSRYDTRQGESRSVERVTKFNLFVFCVAVATF